MSNTNIFTTNSFRQTQKMGDLLAKELKGGEIICLTGELGSGKTTLAQGVLNGLEAKKPYTSPTFVVMKCYKLKEKNEKRKVAAKNAKLSNVYHIDAYRVVAKDIIDLGWEEIIASKNNIIIIEWAERIRNIIPKNALWLKFEHLNKNERKISIK